MNSFLSLHILADGCNEADITRAGQFLATCGCDYYNITTAARYNEAEKLIQRLHDLAPSAKPLWRGWHSDLLKDGDIWRKTTPQEWINYRIAPNAVWLKELGVYVVTCNEVGVLGADARIWSAWEAKCIQLAWEQYGVRLAVLRFSTGNPMDTEHENYNAVLSAAGQYRAIISPNQYTALNGELSTDHHVGRHRWMWQQQDQLGVKRSPIVIGEYALCRFNADNKPDPNHGFGDMNVNIEQHLTVLRRDGVLYQAGGVTVCWYVMGHWQEGGGSFDLHQNEPLLKAVESTAKQGLFDFKAQPTNTTTVPVVSKDLEYGKAYRLSMPGKIVYAYPEKSVTYKPLGSIPDNAVVEVGTQAMVDHESWLQVRYPVAFAGWGWIRIDLIDVRETTTTPIIKIDDPSTADTTPLPSNPSLPPVATTPVTPAPEPKMGYTLDAAQIAMFEAFRVEFVAARESNLAEIKNRTAEIEKYTTWISTIDSVLEKAKE